ncbi:MAG: hypothetical protein HYZ28_01115 [Myxococcales bacterium]|nr:hypothetical protein [Myxococcales bacterium]
MTFLVERLALIREHLDHLYGLRARVRGPASLSEDISLRNDVLHSLQTVCQAVIDVASELVSRKGRAFQDYSEALRELRAYPEFDSQLVDDLVPLAGFRNA